MSRGRRWGESNSHHRGLVWSAAVGRMGRKGTPAERNKTGTERARKIRSLRYGTSLYKKKCYCCWTSLPPVEDHTRELTLLHNTTSLTFLIIVKGSSHVSSNLSSSEFSSQPYISCQNSVQCYTNSSRQPSHASENDDAASPTQGWRSSQRVSVMVEGAPMECSSVKGSCWLEW